MACGSCARNAKKRAEAEAANKSVSSSVRQTRVPVRRIVPNQSAVAPETPTIDSRRPFRPMRYKVISPDGVTEIVNTLAEAQTLVRRGGPGWRMESGRF